MKSIVTAKTPPNMAYRSTLSPQDQQLIEGNDFYFLDYDCPDWADSNIVVQFTSFTDLTDTQGIESQELWSVFASDLVGKGHKTMVEKGGELIGGYWLKEGKTRANANVEICSLFICDIDSKPNSPQPPSFEEMGERFVDGKGIYACSVLGYTTHNHTPLNPRYRLVFPLARCIAPSEYSDLWHAINDELGGILDPATKDIARIQYRPTCPPENIGDAKWFSISSAGPRLEPLVNPEELIIAFRNRNQWRLPLSTAPFKMSQCTRSIICTPETPREIATLASMLKHINADCDYAIYRSVVWGLLSTGWSCAEQIALNWSLEARHRFEQHTFNALIYSYNFSRSPTMGTIYHLARAGGWNG